MFKLIAMGLVALSASLLIGCGGGDGGDGADTQDSAGSATQNNGSGNSRASGSKTLKAADMCKLLTKAEIEAAVGNAVEEGQPDIGISCDWDSGPDDISVAIFLLPVPSSELCVNALKDDAVYKEASGYGDPAFASYTAVQGGSADVVVCMDSGQLQLVVTGGLDDVNTEQKLRTAASDLMKKALSRI